MSPDDHLQLGDGSDLSIQVELYAPNTVQLHMVRHDELESLRDLGADTNASLAFFTLTLGAAISAAFALLALPRDGVEFPTAALLLLGLVLAAIWFGIKWRRSLMKEKAAFSALLTARPSRRLDVPISSMQTSR